MAQRFAAFFAEKSSEKVASPMVLGEVLLLFLHLLQGVGHILHPTVVVLQSFLTGQISPFSTTQHPENIPKQTLAKSCKDVGHAEMWSSPTTKAFPDLPIGCMALKNFTKQLPLAPGYRQCPNAWWRFQRSW